MRTEALPSAPPVRAWSPPSIQRVAIVAMPVLVGLLVGLPILALLINSFNTATIGP